jgi:ATP-dependent Clp protease protease subunit
MRRCQSQPSGGLRGTSVDIEIQAQEMKKIKNELYNIIVEKTGQTFEKVQKDCDNGDYWMNGEEAIAYGALDEIMK